MNELKDPEYENINHKREKLRELANKEKGIVPNHTNNMVNGHDVSNIPISRLNEVIKKQIGEDNMTGGIMIKVKDMSKEQEEINDICCKITNVPLCQFHEALSRVCKGIKRMCQSSDASNEKIPCESLICCDVRLSKKVQGLGGAIKECHQCIRELSADAMRLESIKCDNLTKAATESASKDMNIDVEINNESCFSYDKNCKGEKIKDKEDDSKDDDDSICGVQLENSIRNMIISDDESCVNAFSDDFDYY